MFDGQKLQFAVNYLHEKKTYYGLLLEKSMDTRTHTYIYAVSIAVLEINVLFQTE